MQDMLGKEVSPDKFDQECVLDALRSQFTKDYDLAKIRKRILEHIDAIPVTLKTD